jgi:hypothetical protein
MIYSTLPGLFVVGSDHKCPFIGKVPVSGNPPRTPVPTSGSGAPIAFEERMDGDGSGIPLILRPDCIPYSSFAWCKKQSLWINGSARLDHCTDPFMIKSLPHPPWSRITHKRMRIRRVVSLTRVKWAAGRRQDWSRAVLAKTANDRSPRLE